MGADPAQTQQMVTLESLRDGRGEAYLDTTRLVTDRGAISFEHGRAYEVPRDVAAWICEARGDVFIVEDGRPALVEGVRADPPVAKGPVMATPSEPPGPKPAARAPAAPTAAETAAQRADLAQHLAGDGEEVAEAAMPVYTFDGNPAHVDAAAWTFSGRFDETSGKPLFFYLGDEPGGDATGDGADEGQWHVLDPNAPPPPDPVPATPAAAAPADAGRPADSTAAAPAMPQTARPGDPGTAATPSNQAEVAPPDAATTGAVEAENAGTGGDAPPPPAGVPADPGTPVGEVPADTVDPAGPTAATDTPAVETDEADTAESDVGPEPPVPAAEAAQHVKMIPQGFAPQTAEGDLRCLAAKADGSQCANVAKPGTSACGLASHQAAVAQLPDAG